MNFQTGREKLSKTKYILQGLSEFWHDVKDNGFTADDWKELESYANELDNILRTPVYKKCPKCRNFYHPDREALSRKDNTSICSDCGTREALNDYITNK